MANKLENLELEIAHFNQFKDYLPNVDSLDQATLDTLLQTGIIEVSTAFEIAIANYAGTEVISQDHADLSCGSDAKLSTVRTCTYGTVYSAPVTGIYNKTGDLLVQVYERKREVTYWFRIPYSEYAHIPRTSNIEIPFAMDGTPRRSNRKEYNPWDHECNSFEAMCLGQTVKAKTTATFNEFFE
jgi:hypothetical protein